MGSSTQFIYRKMILEDVSEAAALRMTSQEFGFFSKMDKKFWEIFLSCLIKDPSIISYVAIEQNSNSLAGYIIGTIDTKAMRKNILNDILLEFFWYTFKMLIKTPGQLKLLIKSLFSPKNELNIPEQRWLTWIVGSKFRMHGIGLNLYQKLCTEMHAKGVDYFYGPVDCNNHVSNKAHEKIKAENIGIVIVEGREHYLWKHTSTNWLT